MSPSPPQPSPAAIFLDAAGTLFHLAEPVGATYARIANHHGVMADGPALERAFRATWNALPSPLHPEDSPPQDDDRSWWHTLVRQAFHQVLGQEVPPGKFDPMFAELYGHFARADAWRLFADTLPALDLLGQHGRLFVLSNFDRRLHSILRGLGILDRFEGVILSSEIGASKPHPRIFAPALHAAGVSPAQCLHIGDDARCDEAGARAAGMHAALIDRPAVTLLTIAESVAPGQFPLA